MKIYSMTATFGKLENQTLTLQPGLNIISAPNEWGKSTWCAFLATMLYGLGTREKTTKTALAVKERYAPWSGSPMSGRIDLNWNGRNITIERWTKGRTPLGEFRAYETASGLPLPELTAANCGETLLGVEKSVFLRAGFLRLADLPVTADESLRRRLNALVTTGDESGAGDTLGQKLKDLKNKCRFNRTGLIPQAESQKTALESKLAELHSMRMQQQALCQRQEEVRQQIAQLENHRATLAYQAAQENLRRVAEAEETARFAQLQLHALEEKCRDLPSPEDARKKLHTLQDLQQKQQNARMDAQMLPPPPQVPPTPMCFYGLNGQEAILQAETDGREYSSTAIPAKKPSLLAILLGTFGSMIGLILLFMRLWIPGAILLPAGLGLLAWQCLVIRKSALANRAGVEKQQAITARYGGGTPADWLAQARLYANQQQEYDTALAQHNALRQRSADLIAQLDQALDSATDGMGFSGAMEYLTGTIRQHDALADARREQQRAQSHAEDLRAVTKPVARPEAPDPLTCSAAETTRLLSALEYEASQLQQRLGQYQGRMDALGSETALQQQLDAANTRLQQLNRTYNALELALQTLQSASAELQRRFAPRIAEVARELFGQLTNGRYDRLNLTQELSVNAAAMEEVATRSIQWRSEGTVDQLYFALRLAVARELTPNAPLVLDDALVRFDDTRHARAMEILRQEAENKQIILFTCQGRETTS